MISRRILDIDDPQIGIETHLTRKPRFRVGAQMLEPSIAGCVFNERLWRWSVEVDVAIASVDQDEDSAGFRRALAANDRKGIFRVPQSNVGGHEEIRTEAHARLIIDGFGRTCKRRAPSVDGNAGGLGQFAQHTLGGVRAGGQLPILLEPFQCRARCRPELAIIL